MTMFSTILRREFLDQLLSPKFLIVFLMTLVLVPASLLMNFSSYRNAYLEYDAARRISKETIVVFREPSALSTFGMGLESVLPKQISFGKYSREMKGTQAQDEVLSNITGKIDFVVIASFLLGLFAILYACTLMSGEKEAGTLKLVLSNQTRRSTLLWGKFLGSYVVLIIPLVVNFLVGLILLLLEKFPLFSGENLSRIAVVFVLSLLYLSTLFSLGLLISTRTQRSSVALLTGFLIWITLTFVIPKTSEPIASLIHPVQTGEAMERNRTIVRNQIEKEKSKVLAPLRDKYLSSTDKNRTAWDWDAYRKARGPLAQEYEEKIAKALQDFDAQYEREKATALNLSLNIARLSPASVFTHSALDFCRTGIVDRENFLRSLDVHDSQLYKAVFSKQFQDYFDFDEKGGYHSSMGGDTAQNEKIVFPEFRYKFLSFGDTLSHTAPDVVLLVLFNLIFFAAAYYSFTRYDVR
jgi:ABC-type transport system involved in multi-copper enzyme maturation permease subunit